MVTLPPPPVASTHVRTQTLVQSHILQLHWRYNKVAHGQPAGNYSTSHHIQEHAWRPRKPSHQFNIRADGITANISSLTSFVASVCSSGGSICYIGVIVCGLRRWRWAHSDLPLQMPWMLVVVIVVTLERLFHVLQGAFEKLMVSWKKWGGRCVLLPVRSDGEWRAWLSQLPASHCYTIPTANPGQLIRNSLP